jgi:hypothetical protein
MVIQMLAGGILVVAPLLHFLPGHLACRIIFVDRNLDEILASQRQMLVNRGVERNDTPARHARPRAWPRSIWATKARSGPPFTTTAIRLPSVLIE